MAENKPRLVSVVALDGRDESALLTLAASVAPGIESPVGAAILDAARELDVHHGDVEWFREPDGSGVVARVAGRPVTLGNVALLARLGIPLGSLGDWPERLRRRGQHVLFVAVEGRVAGLVGVIEEPAHEEPLKPVMEDEMSEPRTTRSAAFVEKTQPNREEMEMPRIPGVLLPGAVCALLGGAAEAHREPHGSTPSAEHFPTDPAGLPQAGPTERVELNDGGRFQLRVAPVAKSLGSSVVRLLSYNGSVPGPTLRVRQGTEVVIDVVNDGDLETTVHWHGLRLDNRYDGTSATQRPIPVGGSFTYRLTFPDPGVYWYHPHVREDYGQELGLYGNIVVVPSDPDYWPAADRELTLTLDDIRVEDGRVAPFSRRHPTYSAMGRFGNVFLVNGETAPSLGARAGEVVRLYLTNTANTRVFNVAVPGARMKLVGGDSGRYERETFVEEVLIAPSERAIVDVLFDRPGKLTLEHRTPARTYALATIAVTGGPVEPSIAVQFDQLRTSSDMVAARAEVARYLAADPDKTLALVAEMDMGEATASAAAYVCPMHPEVTSPRADRCSKCGMKLVPASLLGAASESHEHAHHHAPAHAGHHAHSAVTASAPDGIEWEDDMVDMNRQTNPSNTRWKLIDRATGAEGETIDWRFRVGQKVKIRLVNEMNSDHPMPHPFHLHGAGRFLILSRNGAAESNLVWKDTVLVKTAETVDVLFDITHPGVWMAHCHIAEHHESGMMLRFRVEP